MKSLLCVIVKQENLYLRDFIEYYEFLGFDNIVLYDNNDIDGEYPQQVIGDYIKNGFVIYKNVRGKYRFQLEAYNECYKEYEGSYDWIAFFDADEYLYLPYYDDVNQFLEQSCFEDCSMIGFSWMQYGDNGYLHYENKPVFARFTLSATPSSNNNYKALIRGKRGLKIDFFDANSFYYSPSENFIAKTPSGSIPIDNNFWVNNTYSHGYLKHFATLSIEEFLYRRFGRRGYADKASSYNKDAIMKIFASINQITPEKQEIIDEFFENFKIVEDNV